MITTLYNNYIRVYLVLVKLLPHANEAIPLIAIDVLHRHCLRFYYKAINETE